MWAAAMARVLRPGGCLVIGDPGKWSVWAMRRRFRGWLGAKPWRSARFRTAKRLAALVGREGLAVDAIEGAVFYPPSTIAARHMAWLDRQLGAMTTLGAAFLAVRANKGADLRWQERHPAAEPSSAKR